MAGQLPPEGVPMKPLRHTLTAGTVLWRCHEGRFGAGEFNPDVAHEFFKGSRFDPTDKDPYPCLYAALDPVTALSEVLLRSAEFGDGGVRQIPWAQASRYVLSAVRTTADLSLVDLTTAEGLAAVWKDDWLIDTEEYAGTRYRVRVIRERCDDVQGLWWTSKRLPAAPRAPAVPGPLPGPAPRPAPAGAPAAGVDGRRTQGQPAAGA
ncbi:RES family NAD+ phosphorylase, partial [Streptomyces olivaceoviridis]